MYKISCLHLLTQGLHHTQLLLLQHLYLLFILEVSGFYGLDHNDGSNIYIQLLEFFQSP
jgi:hypothetical protein